MSDETIYSSVMNPVDNIWDTVVTAEWYLNYQFDPKINDRKLKTFLKIRLNLMSNTIVI